MLSFHIILTVLIKYAIKVKAPVSIFELASIKNFIIKNLKHCKHEKICAEWNIKSTWNKLWCQNLFAWQFISDLRDVIALTIREQLFVPLLVTCFYDIITFPCQLFLCNLYTRNMEETMLSVNQKTATTIICIL
jgi:hypothetical protein